MICGNDKTQKEIDNDFKVWKTEKLKSVTHLVELNNASAVSHTHNGEPNDPILSNNITENVAKSYDRHTEDDYNTDIGSSLWESKNDMDENVMKHISRHGHKHEAKLRKSRNDINENTRKHTFRHDNDQTGYDTNRKGTQKSQSVTDDVSKRGDSHILVNKRKGKYGKFLCSIIIKLLLQYYINKFLSIIYFP